MLVTNVRAVLDWIRWSSCPVHEHWRGLWFAGPGVPFVFADSVPHMIATLRHNDPRAEVRIANSAEVALNDYWELRRLHCVHSSGLIVDVDYDDAGVQYLPRQCTVEPLRGRVLQFYGSRIGNALLDDLMRSGIELLRGLQVVAIYEADDGTHREPIKTKMTFDQLDRDALASIARRLPIMPTEIHVSQAHRRSIYSSEDQSFVLFVGDDLAFVDP